MKGKPGLINERKQDWPLSLLKITSSSLSELYNLHFNISSFHVKGTMANNCGMERKEWHECWLYNC